MVFRRSQPISAERVSTVNPSRMEFGHKVTDLISQTTEELSMLPGIDLLSSADRRDVINDMLGLKDPIVDTGERLGALINQYSSFTGDKNQLHVGVVLKSVYRGAAATAANGLFANQGLPMTDLKPKVKELFDDVQNPLYRPYVTEGEPNELTRKIIDVSLSHLQNGKDFDTNAYQVLGRAITGSQKQLQSDILANFAELSRIDLRQPDLDVLARTKQLIELGPENYSSKDSEDQQRFRALTEEIVRRYNETLLQLVTLPGNLPTRELEVRLGRLLALVESHTTPGLMESQNGVHVRPHLLASKLPEKVAISVEGYAKNGIKARTVVHAVAAASVASATVMTGAAVASDAVPMSPTLKSSAHVPQFDLNAFSAVPTLQPFGTEVQPNTPIASHESEPVEGKFLPDNPAPSPSASPEGPLADESNMDVDEILKEAQGLATPTPLAIPDVTEKTPIRHLTPDATIPTPEIVIEKNRDWDRDKAFNAEVNATVFTSKYPPIEQSPYMTNVDSFVAELDEYLQTNPNLSDDDITKFRRFTLLAQIIAEYPSYLQDLDLSKEGIQSNDFTARALELLNDDGMSAENGYLYTDVQRTQIGLLLAAAYDIVLSESEKKQIIDLTDSTVVDMSEESKKPKQKLRDKIRGKAPVAEQLSPNEIQSKTLDKMERMGPQWKNRAIVMRYFIQKGYTLEQVSGMIGNFCVEGGDNCEMKPNKEQYGGGPGRTYVQFGSDIYDYDRFGYDIDGKLGEDHEGTLRWYAKKFHGDPGKWDQINVINEFIEWELNHTEIGAGNTLKKADTIYEATDVILNQYERPAERHIDLRLKYARQTYQMYKNIEKQLKQQNREVEQNAGPHESNNKLETYASIRERLENKYGRLSGKLPDKELEYIGDEWGNARLVPDAAKSFRMLSDAFEKQFGVRLALSGEGDAYRSIEGQKGVMAIKGSDYAAPVGTSEHGWGMAVDISTNVDTNAQRHEWLRRNAPKYGWDKPVWSLTEEEARARGYDKPVKTESWHWEYVGGKKVKHVAQKRQHERNQKAPDGMIVSKSGYTFPVAKELFNIGTRIGDYKTIEGFHTGLDIPLPENTPVSAVAGGVIIRAAYDAGGGNIITIDHGNGMFTDYQHLNQMDVKVGQKVKIGQGVGLSGNTGVSTGPHLHIGFSHTANVESRLTPGVEKLMLDPLRYLPHVKAA